MSTETTKWDAGLTDAQRETVEKAARAMWEATVNHLPAWENAADSSRRAHFACALAALRAAYPDDFKPVKRSRGEEVALFMVPDRDFAPDEVLIRRHDDAKTMGLVQPGGFSGSIGMLREFIALAIDSERAAAFEEAAQVAEGNGWSGPLTQGIVSAIRALKDGGAK